MNHLAKAAYKCFLNSSCHAKPSLLLLHVAQSKSRLSSSREQSLTLWRIRTPTLSNQRRPTVFRFLHVAQRSLTQTCGPESVSSSEWKDWWETICAVLFITIIMLGPPLLFSLEPLKQIYDSKLALKALLNRRNTNLLKRRQTIPSNEFIYDILQPNEFRVLVLEPGTERDDVRTRLITVNFSMHLQYEALSYAWGNLETCNSIHCDDRRINISSNLHNALSHLRHPTQVRILWVDALCIDQHDQNERGQQVKLMKDIYSRAKRVLVWVGEETKYVEEAFPTLLRCAPSWTVHGADFMFQKKFDWNRDGFDFSKMPAAKTSPEIEWESVEHLLERPWFTRVWVLQEVAYAREVTLVCGNRSINWAILAIVVMNLQHSGIAASHFTKKAQAGIAAVTEIEKTRAHLGYKRRTLLSVLLSTASSDCSDLRDRIFGVLSLAQEEGLDNHPLLEPNYHLSTAEVYKRFAVWHGCFKSNLDFLACGGIQDESTLPELQNLPSWVPDWTGIKNPHPFVRFPSLIPFYAGRRTGPQDNLLLYQSCRQEHGVLKVRAKPVSVVKSVGRDPDFLFTQFHGFLDPLLEQSAQTNLGWISECKSMAINNTDDDICRQNSEAFWRTMLCGLTGAGSRVPTEFKGDFDRYLEFLQGAAVGRPENEWDGSRALVSVEGASVRTLKQKRFEWALGYRESIAKIESSIYAWTSRRRFGVLEDGKIGFFPTDVATGDQVFILQDCMVPIVLRKTLGDDYRVVGEAYVEGIMYGELEGSSLRDYRYYQLK